MRRLVAGAAIALASCANTGAPTTLRADEASTATDHLFWVGSEGDACRFAASDSGPWAGSPVELAAIGKGARVGIKALKDAPWRCVAGGIYTLQKAGAFVYFFSDDSGSTSDDELISEAAAYDQHPEASPYDADSNAADAVDTALGRAAERGTLVMIVLGANWCHDSRALAGWLQTEHFAALVSERYEVVYVDAGHPQTGEGRNLEIAARFGVEDITGTPTMLVLDSDGTLLNADTAKSWRNAASRSEDEIYQELATISVVEPES